MNPIKNYPFRKIADDVLSRHFGDLGPAVANELATSLVRQVVTNDGHAGFVTSTHQFWFQMVLKSEGMEVGFTTMKGDWGRVLAEDWRVREEEIPSLLHSLNLRQSVECRTRDGYIIRLRVEPKERAVHCDEEREPEEADA